MLFKLTLSLRFFFLSIPQNWNYTIEPLWIISKIFLSIYFSRINTFEFLKPYRLWEHNDDEKRECSLVMGVQWWWGEDKLVYSEGCVMMIDKGKLYSNLWGDFSIWVIFYFCGNYNWNAIYFEFCIFGEILWWMQTVSKNVLTDVLLHLIFGAFVGIFTSLGVGP